MVKFVRIDEGAFKKATMQLDLLNYQEKKKNEELPVNEIDTLSTKFKYGQYFTKPEIVKKLINLLQEYKNYSNDIEILEPSFGTGNFVKSLTERGFTKISGCEIDPHLTSSPTDFFTYDLNKKVDLIIGNPPFTKYNFEESYYYRRDYQNTKISFQKYLTPTLIRKEKEKIENVFILKSLHHLKNQNSSIAFVLPISFFIKNRNRDVKAEILKKFSTVIIYQNKDTWFDYHIPCCFAIFTNIPEFKEKILLHFENGGKHVHTLKITNFYDELIPEVIYNKANGLVNNDGSHELSDFISERKAHFKKSFQENNISAKNILEHTKIPLDANISDYHLAITRVGNSSIGKCGLIDIKKDILNDMFYVFDFKENFKQNKVLKENVCEQINRNQSYFKNVTCRVGSKSIKKEDVHKFKIDIPHS